MNTPVPFRDLDLPLLRLFDTLFRTGQLTRAADEIGVTQSAASQALARLRRGFSDPLFLRSRAGMTPTPMARLLAPQIRHLLASIDAMIQQALTFDPATSDRLFRVAFALVDETGLLSPILSRLQAHAPALRLQAISTTFEEAEAQLTSGAFDLMLSYAPPAADRLSAELVLDAPSRVIARHGHPRIDGRLTAAQFFAERHITLALTAEQRMHISRLFDPVGQDRDVLLEVSHHGAIPFLVAQSDALALLPEWQVRSEFFRNMLQVLPVPFELPTLQLYASWHEAVSGDPGHAWLRAALLDALAGMQPHRP
ncbi:LysR family transcriptional regulator [Zavarzinia compransoris]|uniref:LysR family transcriptional regulator n=1 Tax=Zavarzinia marina TaxID=2911065 RepID=UPI001F374FC9|nr:LysR family transcriptional regulator [Zavarzinia marina]MCF4167350.1 LysR family transcriptional regulator [Zavarzinia marina]